MILDVNRGQVEEPPNNFTKQTMLGLYLPWFEKHIYNHGCS